MASPSDRSQPIWSYIPLSLSHPSFGCRSTFREGISLSHPSFGCRSTFREGISLSHPSFGCRSTFREGISLSHPSFGCRSTFREGILLSHTSHCLTSIAGSTCNTICNPKLSNATTTSCLERRVTIFPSIPARCP
jgi:hypothetical protein